ncbi:MAG: PKD domain-containing protein [Bacteroidia bacterium]|nr:PKD domain-containing protein [Bacteroidia bacterium]MCZ2247883.1 PKD domain-containing protein [Bacteroidia bacterium]
MKKYFTFKLLLGSFLTFGWAIQAQSQNFVCGSTEAQQELYQKHPELQQQQADFDAYVRDYINQNYNKTNRNQIIIPVVFHVIHDYGVENISDAQIIDQINILNRDYNKLNADTALALPEFKPIIANVGIEFRLAQIDPNGNCTNGIDRIASPYTYLGNDQAKLNPWDRRKYLNIWTVKKMRDGVAGYAYKPISVSGANFPIDGIIILHDYIGSIGTGNPSGSSRALTHEIGHWLNLSHVWGDNNSPGGACGDDGIQDTPVTKGYTTCPAPTACSICDPNIRENYQNYMDYSYCEVMFTEGQKQAMLAALSSDVSFRNNLWTPENLAATGVLSPTVCSPKADFFAVNTMVCNGTTVNFKDNSTNATPTSWSWSFPGGTPSTSTVQNPSVKYDTPGIYPVTLTVTNAQGTSTTTKDNYMIISPNWSDYNASYSESFEDQTASDKWIKINASNNLKQWSRTADVGYTGSSSMLLSGYYQAHGDVDELISPSYDLRYMTNMTMSFKYIGASKATNYSDMRDSLTVYISTDCGKSWGAVKLTIKRANLIKAGYSDSFFKPSASDNWTTATLNLSSTYAQPNVRFRFRYFSGQLTNNFYIDDFNISGVLSISDMEADGNSINVYPNPFDSETYVTINTVTENQKVTVNLLDLTGRTVVNIFEGTQVANEAKYKLERNNIAAGIYLIKAEVGQRQVFKKVIIE